MRPLAVRTALGIAAFLMILGAMVSLVTLVRQQVPLREMPWTVSRAAGLTAYGLLTVLVLSGILLSHPRLRVLSARIFPWHRLLGMYTGAFLALHITAVILDPYARVGVLGALWPGQSAYRTLPVALGTLSLWAFLVTGLTAHFAARLPRGTWNGIHRFAVVAFYLAFFHGALTGSDTPLLGMVYNLTGAAVTGAALWRYWVLPKSRAQPTASSVQGRSG